LGTVRMAVETGSAGRGGSDGEVSLMPGA